MAKQLLFREDARNQLKEGVDRLADTDQDGGAGVKGHFGLSCRVLGFIVVNSSFPRKRESRLIAGADRKRDPRVRGGDDRKRQASVARVSLRSTRATPLMR